MHFQMGRSWDELVHPWHHTAAQRTTHTRGTHTHHTHHTTHARPHTTHDAQRATHMHTHTHYNLRTHAHTQHARARTSHTRTSTRAHTHAHTTHTHAHTHTYTHTRATVFTFPSRCLTLPHKPVHPQRGRVQRQISDGPPNQKGGPSDWAQSGSYPPGARKWRRPNVKQLCKTKSGIFGVGFEQCGGAHQHRGPSYGPEGGARASRERGRWGGVERAAPRPFRWAVDERGRHLI